MSFNAKLALLISGALVLSTVAVSLFTGYSVERSMGAEAEKSARNAMGLVLQSIEGQYESLTAYREQTLKMRREQMQNVSRSLVAALDHFYELQERGGLSEARAKASALKYLRSVRYGNDDYFFTYNLDMVAISHPDPKVMGRDMSGFRDAKGCLVMPKIKELITKHGSGFLDFWFWRLNDPEPSPKLGYVFLYPKWNWIIGTGVYIDDVDREAARRLGEIKDDLSWALDRVRIAQSGFVFVVDGAGGEVVISARSRDPGFLSEDFKAKELLSRLVQGARAAAGGFTCRCAAALDRGPERVWMLESRRFEPLDWYVVSAVPESELEAPGRRLMMHLAWINAAILVLGLAFASFLGRRLTRPLRTLTSYAGGLPERDFRLSETALAAVRDMEQRYRDEVGRLAGSFLAMERALQDYIQDLKLTTAAKERIESELRIARDIQMGIIPKLFPPFPERTEFEIYASIEPAREVGGDLYDFFFLDRDRFFFLIGDVSGKGVPAALFMAVTKTLVKATAERGLGPGEVLTKVNADLSENNESCMFVTLFCALINLATGEVRYANAGHNPPLVLPRQGPARMLAGRNQIVAGAMPGAAYATDLLRLEPGEALFLYTDGVTEAMDASQAMYGEDRLMEVVDRARSLGARELVSAVNASISGFAGGAEQSDDITMLAIRYLGPPSG